MICQSSSIQDDFIQTYDLPKDKVITIYNPVDINRIRTNVIATDDPYGSKLINIISVGRLTYIKGTDLLIRALAHISKVIPDLHLTILGKGKEKSELQRLAYELGINAKITFAGFMKNPYPYLVYADLFVLPSRYEVLSNALLEALACGLPVVASDAPGGTTDIIENGINGWLVKSENVESLATGIKRALSTPLTLTGDKLLETIENKFGIQTIISQYEAVFQKL